MAARRSNPKHYFDLGKKGVIDGLKPDPTKKLYTRYDTVQQYLGIEVHKHKKGWIMLKRALDEKTGKTKPVIHRIGNYPSIDVEQARAAVRLILDKEYKGESIIPKKMVWATVATVYKAFMADKDLEESTRYTWGQYYKHHIKDAFGNSTFKQIEYDDINKWYKTLNSTMLPSANRSLGLLRQLWRYAIATNKTNEHNYAAEVKMQKEESRANNIPKSKICDFWNALKLERPQHRDYYQLLLLIGPRKQELQKMRWDQLHLDNELPHWGPYKSKTSKNTKTYLSSYAVDILRKRQLDAGDSPYVFPGKDPNKPMYIQAAVWNRIKVKSGLWSKDREHKHNLTIHDLRRTFASIMGDFDKIPDRVVSACLNHRRGGATAIYLRQYPHKVLRAMELVGKRIIKLATREPKPNICHRSESRNVNTEYSDLQSA